MWLRCALRPTRRGPLVVLYGSRCGGRAGGDEVQVAGWLRGYLNLTATGDGDGERGARQHTWATGNMRYGSRGQRRAVSDEVTGACRRVTSARPCVHAHIHPARARMQLQLRGCGYYSWCSSAFRRSPHRRSGGRQRGMFIFRTVALQRNVQIFCLCQRRVSLKMTCFSVRTADGCRISCTKRYGCRLHHLQVIFLS